MGRPKNHLGESDTGVAEVEYIVLVATVAIGFAAATVPLGALLLDYHWAIEFVLLLPVP